MYLVRHDDSELIVARDAGHRPSSSWAAVRDFLEVTAQQRVARRYDAGLPPVVVRAAEDCLIPWAEVARASLTAQGIPAVLESARDPRHSPLAPA
jgi:hypothetical protein